MQFGCFPRHLTAAATEVTDALIYHFANGVTTVFFHVTGFLVCYGIKEKPSRRYERVRVVLSLSVFFEKRWPGRNCRWQPDTALDRPDERLHTNAWRPNASACDSQRHKDAISANERPLYTNCLIMERNATWGKRKSCQPAATSSWQLCKMLSVEDQLG